MPLLRHFSVNTQIHLNCALILLLSAVLFFNLSSSLSLSRFVYIWIYRWIGICDVWLNDSNLFWVCLCVCPCSFYWFSLLCRLLFPFHFYNRSCSFRQRQHPFAIHETSLIRHRRNGTCYCIVPISVWVHFEWNEIMLVRSRIECVANTKKMLWCE